MCKQCKTKPVYEFTNKRRVCASCFIRYFQKKFLYIIRKFKMIKKHDLIGYKPGKDFRDVVLGEMLNMFAEKAPVEIRKGVKGVNRIAINNTTDIEAYEIVEEIINKRVNVNNFLPINKKIIKPLYLFLDKEVMLYAKLKGLKFKKPVKKKDRIVGFIDEMEKKHPEIKRAIVNSVLGL